MPGEHTFYDGSTVLKGLEPYIGVEVDKVCCPFQINLPFLGPEWKKNE